MHKIYAPKGVQLFEGSLSTFWFDEEGILYSRTKNVPRTIPLIEENHDLIRELTGNSRVCIISETTDLPPLPKEVREYLSRTAPDMYKAMAILSNSGSGKLTSDLYLNLQNHLIPTKMFVSEEEAKDWIRQYL